MWFVVVLQWFCSTSYSSFSWDQKSIFLWFWPPFFWRGHWHPERGEFPQRGNSAQNDRPERGEFPHRGNVAQNDPPKRGEFPHRGNLAQNDPPKGAEKTIFLGLFLERVRAPKTSQISTAWKFSPFWGLILGHISTLWKSAPFGASFWVTFPRCGNQPLLGPYFGPNFHAVEIHPFVASPKKGPKPPPRPQKMGRKKLISCFWGSQCWIIATTWTIMLLRYSVPKSVQT